MQPSMSTGCDENVGVDPTGSPAAGHGPDVAALHTSTNDAAERFTDLFHQHWHAVHAYAIRRCPSAADAHDVAADTFTVAWRRFAEIPPGHELPWLYRTAANVLSNSARSARRRIRLDDRLSSQPDRPSSTLEDDVAEDQALQHAFGQLTEEQQELLALVAWEGLDHEAIAEVLDISVGAVSSRLSRARARFDELLATADGDAGHEEGVGERRRS